jgi:hypothetical protein
MRTTQYAFFRPAAASIDVCRRRYDIRGPTGKRRRFRKFERRASTDNDEVEDKRRTKYVLELNKSVNGSTFR